MKFKQNLFTKPLVCLGLFVFSFIALLTVPVAIKAQQTDENISTLKQKAADLIAQQKFTEALPLLEKAVVVDPSDARMHFYLGFALIGKAKTLTDNESRLPLVIRARGEFVKAKELGIDEPVVDSLIQSIPADDNIFPGGSSQNQAATNAMEQGEAFFSQGKFDEALAAYQKALSIDPQMYEAALYSGDVYMQKDDFANAEIWYQKAIAIDPNRETAYRYSATPLMKQHKYDQARDRYIEAYISEPYSSFSRAGLTQWGASYKLSARSSEN